MSVAGLSIDGTMPKMYTGTSMPLATPDTSLGVSRLALSPPSVNTITARRRPSRWPTCSAVRAIASWSDVAPKGTTDDIDSGSVRSPDVNGITSIEPRVEREDCRLVLFRLQPAEDMSGGFARVGHLGFHAAADVEQQRHADARQIGPEIRDRPRLPVVEHFEVAR